MKTALAAVCVSLALLAPCAPVRAQAVPVRIVEWVENAPLNDNSKIALGYPVPIPVDTPLPFAGFRSYAGLHMRHQDLAATTPWVHPSAIGTTQRGRTIWLYRLGDADLETAYGLPEQAMLTNGGIHAREWQSPEVATGIIELLALGADDGHLLSYLRDNANVLVIPVLNVDSFLQTQRFPRTNWLGTDPDDPEGSPRDGRMRRKNMRDADESLETQADHLQGIDLNRNNPPYWATNLTRSSYDPESLVYHGTGPQSEAETQALDAAAQLGPAGRLSMYTDLHSFSRQHFWVRNGNDRLANLTEDLLRTFTEFHRRFPAGKYYAYATANSAPRNQGIGATDEYFTQEYQVPAWTLEIEPANSGAEYGGLGRNGHDGFILPDAQVERVRTELAQTFAIAYYRQAGPPSITALHLTDAATGAVVFQAEWDAVSATQRQLHTFQAQPLQLGRDYRAWIAWDKPMRWRTDGQVTVLPGQPAARLNVAREATVDSQALETVIGPPRWLDQPGASPAGYRRYRDDAMDYDLAILDNAANRTLVQGNVLATLHTDAFDLSGNRGDANPASVARWEDGAWAGYEDGDGDDGNDQGGSDSTLRFALTADALGDPFAIEAGTSAAWFDTERNGEGFVLEVLGDGRAVMYWFTYDSAGRQDWYVAEGEIRGNRILFPELLRVGGGEFGPGFDPGQVTRTPVGSASFIWSSCDSGAMSWVIDRDGGGRRQGHMNLTRLSRVMGLDCGMQIGAPEVPAGRFSGSWYDPAHSGEGYVLEVLADLRALVYWFSFDGAGARRWFFGTGRIEGDRLLFDELFTTAGGVFGPGFDPDTVTVAPWGSLELDLTCSAGTARFVPTEAGFPAGTLDLVRLSRLGGLDCAD
jgi:Zinc carboxypeptidase